MWATYLTIVAFVGYLQISYKLNERMFVLLKNRLYKPLEVVRTPIMFETDGGFKNRTVFLYMATLGMGCLKVEIANQP